MLPYDTIVTGNKYTLEGLKMAKPNWVTVGCLESHEKTDSFKALMKKFITFCNDKGYKKNSAIDFTEFTGANGVGPIQLKMLSVILELRKYTKNNKLIHEVRVIQDNFEFRSNRVAYLMKKYLNKTNETAKAG